MQYILASASARRQELLKRIVDNFNIVVSNFNEEDVVYNNDIDDYVKILAEGKATDVANKSNENSIIIGADTIVVMNNKVLGKPKNEDEAFDMLKMLSNNTHRVYSGVVVINKATNITIRESIYTEVSFSKLSDEEIWDYIKTNEPFDKAGAYGIQGLGGVFVEKINGCYYNVVGLPLNLLNKMLKKVM